MNRTIQLAFALASGGLGFLVFWWSQSLKGSLYRKRTHVSYYRMYNIS